MTNLVTRQRAVYKAQNWWRWSVWVDGPADELDRIEYVEYTLHPSFPNPVQEKRNRSQKFRISASGWGQFEIYVRIRFEDGTDQKLTHRLNLEYPTEGDEEAAERSFDERQAPTKGSTEQSSGRPRKLLLSYGQADAQLANAIRRELGSRGFEVLRTSDVDVELPADAIMKLVARKADMAVAVISDRPSEWVMREMAYMRDHKMAAIPIVVGTDSNVPSELTDKAPIHVNVEDDLKLAASNIADEIVQRQA